MKNIIIYMLAILMLTACESYTETEQVANKTWPLMTTREKVIYQRVHDRWGEKKLVHLRSGIRQRSIQPFERMDPFKDLGGVIKAIDNSLIIQSGLDANNKNKYARDKFSAIDREWFERVTKSKAPPVKVYIKEEKEINLEVEEVRVVDQAKQEEEIQFINPNQLASEVDLIKVSIFSDSCDAATEYLNKIIEDRRPVTLNDLEIIKSKSMYCSVRELMHGSQ
ncbi:hypothetical protein KAR91_13090 [Candidatus Pacearchaeota archaeon]|nr:hypothetical protein [Candidatus Pacearchaeota archaeon]